LLWNSNSLLAPRLYKKLAQRLQQPFIGGQGSQIGRLLIGLL
jgi:hypothetical protein